MLLKVEHLSKTFTKNHHAFKAVNDLSFEVATGDIVAFLGPNGAGKTTSLKAILNLLVPEQGKIYFEDHLLKHDFYSLLANSGVVLESSHNMFWSLTPMDNFVYWGGQRGLSKNEAQQRGLALLQKFKLADKKDTVIFQLSRGMQQIISICCALIARPKFLILDEPTLGLDLNATQTMCQMLKTLAQEKIGILITTHQLDFAQKIANQLLLIKQGKIVYAGATKACLAKFNQEKIFFAQFKQKLTAFQEEQILQLAHLQNRVGDKYEIILKDKKQLSPLLKLLNQFSLLDLTTKTKNLNDVFQFYAR